MNRLIAAFFILCSSHLLATPDIHFSKDCAHAGFDFQEGDISFFNLNLDLDSDKKVKNRLCEIAVKFPANKGQRLVVSQFQVEAFAQLERRGVALLSLEHNLNDQWRRRSDDRAVKPGAKSLLVSDKILQKMPCGKSAWLKTNIITAVRNGVLFQDNAIQVIKLNYHYENCKW
ncbi:MAG: hypothetical protein ACOH5I_18065 [Oligoflexus sp.]